MNCTDEGAVSPTNPMPPSLPPLPMQQLCYWLISAHSFFPSPPKELPHFFTGSFPPSPYLSTSQGGGVKRCCNNPRRQQLPPRQQTMPRPCPGIKHLPKKCSPPLKHHPALPSTSSSLFPAQRSGGQDRNIGVASSLLRHILASSRKHRMQAERKASHRGGQSPRHPHQTKYYTQDIHQNSRNSGNFKATPNTGGL